MSPHILVSIVRITRAVVLLRTYNQVPTSPSNDNSSQCVSCQLPNLGVFFRTLHCLHCLHLFPCKPLNGVDSFTQSGNEAEGWSKGRNMHEGGETLQRGDLRYFGIHRTNPLHSTLAAVLHEYGVCYPQHRLRRPRLMRAQDSS
jgi:hypothetical protein